MALHHEGSLLAYVQEVRSKIEELIVVAMVHEGHGIALTIYHRANYHLQVILIS